MHLRSAFAASWLIGLSATACVVQSRRAPVGPPPPAPVLQPVGVVPLAGPATAHGFASSAPSGPAQMPAHIANGRPTGMHPGAPAAYWIWHNRQGQWRVRVTTGGRNPGFRGTVAASPGSSVLRVVASRAELSDAIRATAESFDFDLSAATSMDGFDFQVAHGCVRFLLEAANARPQVFVGPLQFQPPTPHFVLCP